MQRPSGVSSSGPTITRVRVLERGPDGMHVRLQISDGRIRTVWVPEGILSRGSPEVVSPTDGGPHLGHIVTELIGILSVQPGSWQDALHEESWVGPGPTAPSSLDQVVIRRGTPPPVVPRGGPTYPAPTRRGWDPDTAIVALLGVGAVLAFVAVAVMVFVLLW